MARADVQIVSVALPRPTAEQLRQIATAEDRSVSSLIRLAVHRVLADGLVPGYQGRRRGT